MPRGRGMFPAHMGSSLWKSAATALIYIESIGGTNYVVSIDGTSHEVISSQASGITDDVVFNATFVYVNALGGGSVFFDEGDYVITATLSVQADILFYGAGWNSILQYDASGNCITITGNNVEIRDLKITITAGAGAAGSRPNCILADTLQNLDISNVWMIGDESVGDDAGVLRQSGIVFDGVTYSRITLCRSEDHRRYGYILNNSSINIVGENVAYGNLLNGIVLFDTSDLNNVLGNICNINTQYGMLVSGTSQFNNVTGNNCNGNLFDGMLLLNGSDNNSVTGNTCRNNVHNGMIIDDSSNNNIVGNVCNENDSLDTATYDGINITDTSLDNLIHNNTCNDNDGYGINIDDANALRNWCKNNELRGNTTGAFNDTGTDTKVHEENVRAPNPDSYIGQHATQQMLDNVVTNIRFETPLKAEFQELVTADIIVVPEGTGNLACINVADYGRICHSEAYNTHDGSVDYTIGDVVAVVANRLECIDVTETFATNPLTAYDWIGATFIRSGAEAGDTVDAVVQFVGFRLRYV